MSFDAAKPFHEGREKWSEERISELKRLHQLGFSAGQIAKHIGGATRNAVIGKINRLGLLRYKTINKSPLQIKGRIDGRTTRKTRRTAINLKPKAIILSGGPASVLDKSVIDSYYHDEAEAVLEPIRAFFSQRGLKGINLSAKGGDVASKATNGRA